MADFNELVKNLYETKNRELTQEKLDYINKTYAGGKEEDFVKNFYATIQEELPEEKFNYIREKYLKKKDEPISTGSKPGGTPGAGETPSSTKQKPEPIKAREVKLPIPGGPKYEYAGEGKPLVAVKPISQKGVAEQLAPKPTKEQEKIDLQITAKATPENQSIFQEYERNQSGLKRAQDASQPKAPVGITSGMVSPVGMQAMAERMVSAKKEKERLMPLAEASYKKLEPAVNDLVESSIKDAGINYWTKVNETGDVIPDIDKIDSWSKRVAKSNGISDEGYAKKILYNRMASAVDYELIRPKIESEQKAIYKKKYGVDMDADIQKDFETSFLEGKKIQSETLKQADILKNTLREEQKVQLETLNNDFQPIIENKKASYQEKVNQLNASIDALNKLQATGQIDQNTYKSQYDSYSSAFQQLNKDNEQEFNAIVADYQKRLNEVNSKFDRRYQRQMIEIEKMGESQLQRAAAKYGKTYKANPELEKRLKETYDQASKRYKTYDEVRKLSREKQQFVGSNILNDMITGFGQGIKMLSSYANYDAGYVYGDALSKSRSMANAEISNWKDLLDPTKLIKSASYNIAMQAPAFIAQAATTVATRGASLPAQLAIQGGLGFVTDNIMTSGQVYDQVFLETGSVEKADKAASKMILGNTMMLPIYFIDGIPFIENLSLGIKNQFIRGIAKGGIETVAEIPQEYFQNVFEDLAVEDKSLGEFTESLSLDKFKETALNVIPSSFAMGAGPDLIGASWEMAKKPYQYVKGRSLAAKMDMSNLETTNKQQWFYDTYLNKGETFTKALLNAMYTGGKINDAELADFNNIVNQSKAVQETSRKNNLNAAQSKVYAGMMFDYAQAKSEAATAKDDVTKKAAEDRMKEVEANASDFLNTKKGSYAVLTLADKTQFVYSYKTMEDIISGSPVIRDQIKNGEAKMSVVADGKNKDFSSLVTAYEGVMKAPAKPEVTTEEAAVTSEVAPEVTTPAGVSPEVQELTTKKEELVKERERLQEEKAKVEPVSEAVAPVDIEAKKADIERRRQEELQSVIQTQPIEILDEEGNVVSTTDKTVEINAKYDAELAALETAPTPTPKQKKAEGVAKIYDKPELETPVYQVIINGKERFIQKVFGNSAAETGWIEVVKDKDGVWTDVKAGRMAYSPDEYTKSEMIERLKREAEKEKLSAAETTTEAAPSAIDQQIADIDKQIADIEAQIKKAGKPKKKAAPAAAKEKAEGKKRGRPSKKAAERVEGVSASNAEQLDALANKYKDDTVKSKIIEAVKKGLKTLRSILPDMDIVILESDADFDAYVTQEGSPENKGSRAAAMYMAYRDGKASGEGVIAINLNKANFRSVAHEIAHMVLAKAFGENAELFKDFKNKVAGLIKDTKVTSAEGDTTTITDDKGNRTSVTYKDGSWKKLENGNYVSVTSSEQKQASKVNESKKASLIKELDAFVDGYKTKGEGLQAEEFLVELAGYFSQGQNVPVSLMTKIAALINEFVSKITKGRFQPFEGVASAKRALEFFQTIGQAVAKGESLLDIIDAGGLVGTGKVNGKAKAQVAVGQEMPPQQTRTSNFSKVKTISLAKLNGVGAVLTGSDRLTTAVLKFSDGTTMSLKGGIFYPSETGLIWASTSLKEASGLAKEINKVIKEKGEAWLFPVNNAYGSQMSNYTFFETAMRHFEIGVKNKTVSKEDVIEKLKEYSKTKKFQEAFKSGYTPKAFAVDLENTSLEEIYALLHEDFVPENATYKGRKGFIESFFGGIGTVARPFDGVPNTAELIAMTTEPANRDAREFTVTSAIKITGVVNPRKTTKSKDGDFFHSAYPATIETSGTVESYVLDGTYNVEDVFPEFVNSSGETVTWEGLQKEFKERGEEATFSNYKNKFISAQGAIPRAAIVSAIRTKLPEPTAERITEASDSLKKKFKRDGMPLNIDEAKEIVYELVSWKDWYEGIANMVQSNFDEYSADYMMFMFGSAVAADSAGTIGTALNNLERLYAKEEIMGLPIMKRNIYEILSGLPVTSDKINNFIKAGLGDKTAIPVDMHVWSFINSFPDTKKKPTKKGFERAKEFVNAVADALGWDPREVQAAMWAANMLRLGQKPDTYEEYIQRKVDKGLKQKIQGWREKGYKPVFAVRQSGEKIETVFLDKSMAEEFAPKLEEIKKKKPADEIGLERVSKAQMVEPTSEKWKPSLTEAEVDQITDGAYTENLKKKEAEGAAHATQITTTRDTYKKWAEWLGKNMPNIKNAKILDVGAGFGHIHKQFENILGIKTKSYEPFYNEAKYQEHAGKAKPDYVKMDASDIPGGQFDVVVNNAVLNVIPRDIRDNVVRTIGYAMKPGGMGIINAMSSSYTKDQISKIDQGKSTNVKLSDSEVFTNQGGKFTYQKGFTTSELAAYVKDVLGDDFEVTPAPKEITSMTTVVVKRKPEVEKKGKAQVSGLKHGSPYDFESFDTEKIGTGEGAQAFGWGLYFTDLESIAKDYAEKLTRRNVKDMYDSGEDMNPNAYAALEAVDFLGFENEWSAASAFYGQSKERIMRDYDLTETEYDRINNAFLEGRRNLYEVTIHKGKTPDQYTWLEWDKAVSKSLINKIKEELKKQKDNFVEQKKYDSSAQYLADYYGSALSRFSEANISNGEQLYKALSRALESAKDASMFLLENGIDGVKYPAESISRGATSETARGFNYVVFDANAVTIEKKTKFQRAGVDPEIADIVQDYINDGWTNVAEIQESLAELLEDDSIELADQVASAYGQLAPAEKIDYTPANKELFSKFEKIDKAAKAVQEYETAVGKAKATQKYEDAVSNAGLTKQQEFVEKNFDDIVNDLKDKGILNTKCK